MSIQGSLSVAEREKYRDIFLHLNPKDGLLSGLEAQTVLLKSGLSNSQLEQIWSLSDLDQDGELSCEEFIIAMHLIYNTLNGMSIPDTLPAYLLPGPYHDQLTTDTSSSKDSFSKVSNKRIEFTDTFDWYISPSQKLKYETTFHDAPLKAGLLSKEHALEIFLSNSRPRDEFDILWNLIDVYQKGHIQFQQYSYFHHVMDARKQNKPFPTSIPPEIILTFKSTLPLSTASVSPVKSSNFEKLTLHSPTVTRRRSFAASPPSEVADLEAQLADLELRIASATRSDSHRDLLDEVHALLAYLDTALKPCSPLELALKSAQQEIKQAECHIQRERSTTI